MAEKLKSSLNLLSHVEGGSFLEIYRNNSTIPPVNLENGHHNSKRGWSSHIYYLLSGAEYSKFHRLRCDEGLSYYAGNTAMLVHCIAPDGTLTTNELDPKAFKFYVNIPKGTWFGMELANQSPDSYVLIGCTVAPAFDYAEFELGNRKTLIDDFPKHAILISKLT